MRSISIIILTFMCSTPAFPQQGKKVQFLGGARSQVTNSKFMTENDSITAPKSSGGYALLDLGIKINPNQKTEVLGMFRINNAFGGFWGGSVSFDVRQLYVRGVAADVVRYHIGNIDYKLTPYTFYNHNTDFLTSSLGVLKIKEDVLNYESFYSNNTWRQQGASVNFALQFPKIIDEIEFNGFISRLNPTDLNSILERLYGGGNMVINQGKNVKLGLNHVSVFDLAGTAIDSNIYNNNVSTFTYDFQFENDQFTYGLDGESGIGVTSESLYPEKELSDFFVHTRAYLNLKKLRLNFNFGYMDNGPDFRSFGAQSRRVNFNQQNSFYNRYTNSQILRPVSMFDMYNDPNLINQGISVGVMDYNPAVNNALPFGIATFNRRGAYMGVNYSDKKQIFETNGKLYYLSEIRGQGTTNLKSFLIANMNGALHANKLWGGKKELNAQLGVTLQQTTRNGEFTFQNVDLTSTLINFGLEAELIDDLFIMGNLFLMKATGKDQLPDRNADDVIINYNDFIIDGNELNIASGLRFDFSKKAYLAAMYESNTNTFVVDNPYTFNQMSIFYVMKF